MFENDPEMQTKARDIIISMLMYYQTHPRATLGGCCAYSMSVTNGQCKETRCAVGQFLQEDVRKQVGEEELSLRGLIKEFGDTSDETLVDRVLIEDVHGLPIEFWEELQDIHDTDSNWDSWFNNQAHLTRQGWAEVNRVVKGYGIGQPIEEEDIEIP